MTNEQLWSLAREGDREAVSLLIERIQPSIRFIAGEIKNKYPGIMLEKDDLVQEALIGSMKAIETYDPETNNKFLTYARKIAKNAMLDYARKFRSELRQSGGFLRFDESPPGYDPADGVTYKNIIPDMFSKTPEQIVIKEETIMEVREALQEISGRERKYLYYRYGFEDGLLHNLAETASHFHLSKSRARSLESTALDNVRRELFWW